MELLLLSNSKTADGGYLAHAVPEMTKLAAGRRRAFFVPFAGVTNPWDNYANTVREALAATGLDIIAAHEAADPLAEIARTECIIVGGGNTWQLLKECRERGFLEAIPKRVREGVPYMGWSAGANMSCPTIATTNDMPIVDPRGFAAFGLIDFQINPHYTNALPEGHKGETRNQRIAEYLVANPTQRVLGVPEGCWLRVSGSTITLAGHKPAVLFLAGQEPREIPPGPLPKF